jgi:hypothetical protein
METVTCGDGRFHLLPIRAVLVNAGGAILRKLTGARPDTGEENFDRSDLLQDAVPR